MKSKVAGQLRPAFIEQELHGLNNKGKKRKSCCDMTRSETHQNLTAAHCQELENLDNTHRTEIQTLETAHRAQIDHLIASHKAQITNILEKIRHEAQKITHKSTKTNLDFITQDTPPSSSETSISIPNGRTSCDNCYLTHVKCTKKAPEMQCSRCIDLDMECVHSSCGPRDADVRGLRGRDHAQ